MLSFCALPSSALPVAVHQTHDRQWCLEEPCHGTDGRDVILVIRRLAPGGRGDGVVTPRSQSPSSPASGKPRCTPSGPTGPKTRRTSGARSSFASPRRPNRGGTPTTRTPPAPPGRNPFSPPRRTPLPLLPRPSLSHHRRDQHQQEKSNKKRTSN